MGRVHKEGFGTIWLEKKTCLRSKQKRDSELEPKVLTPASRDNGIKKKFVVVVSGHKGPK